MIKSGDLGTGFRVPSAIGVFANATHLFITDQANDRITPMRLTSNGVRDTSSAMLPGIGRGWDPSDGVLASATFSDPRSIAVAPNGDIFVAGELLMRCQDSVHALSADQ
jgi:hypothetical protein